MTDQASSPPLQTPLYDDHLALKGRMVDFAGYELPVQYSGIMAEHQAVRASAGVFDVSHMGQVHLSGPDFPTLAAALERIAPSNIQGLKPGETRYSVLLNEDGGIIDDLMITRPFGPDSETMLFLVLNASRKHVDIPAIDAILDAGMTLYHDEDAALIALQGPEAGAVVAQHAKECSEMRFMQARSIQFDGIPAHATRSGYTGEDGFEISVLAGDAPAVWATLLDDGRVVAAGLGARDSLRLEAGLCLYGHDLDETTSPIEGNIRFVIPKRRREAGDFPGAARILAEIGAGPSRLRVGLTLDGRAPAREGAEIQDAEGRPIGHVTSGGFAPSLQAPIAMGYVDASAASENTPVQLIVRGRALAARIAPMPFVSHRYLRASSTT